MSQPLSFELHDAWERVILPGVAAMLPAHASHRLLAWLSRHSAVVEQACQSAWQGAAPFAAMLNINEAEFKSRHRLYWLVDFADLFLLRTRSNAWLDRYVERHGASLPAHAPVMALTFHFGAGMWAMRALGRSGRKFSWLHAPVDATFADEQKVLSRLGRLRIRTVEEATGSPAIPTGGSFERMGRWIDQGGGITALVDAPHFGNRNTSLTTVLGQPFYLANGLARLAQAKNCEVFFYTTSLVGDGPMRRLHCEGPYSAENLDSLIQNIGAFMDREIRRDPAAWHLWAHLSQFGIPPNPA